MTEISMTPITSPRPGRPFVDREAEFQVVAAKLNQEALKGKPIRAGVICFWGAFGMGKSWLLKELEAKLNDQDQTKSSHPAVAVRLDLRQDATSIFWSRGGFEREKLISDLWRQFADILGAAGPDDSSASVDEMAHTFVDWLTGWAVTARTPVILLDTVDDLIKGDPSSFAWLESHLIEPLAITDRVVFVLTSRGVIKNWKSFHIKRRIHIHKITGFTAKFAGEAVDAGEEAGRFLYRYTFGHPFANERLAFYLKEKLNLNLGDIAGQTLSLGEPAIKQILGPISKEILRVLPESLLEVGQAVSVLRWVSVESLRWLCERMGYEHPGLGDAYYLDQVIGVLQAHHLLYWNSARNCYDMDPVLRRLLAYAWKENAPGLCDRAHRAAYDFHLDHLNQYPAYLKDYAPELLFHLVALVEKPDGQYLIEDYTKWWAAFPPVGDMPPTERWKELLAALQQDQELRETVPHEFYQALLERAARYSSQTQEQSHDEVD